MWHALFQQRWGGIVFPTTTNAPGPVAAARPTAAVLQQQPQPPQQPVSDRHNDVECPADRAHVPPVASLPSPPPALPAGRWRMQYQLQLMFEARRACPVCGTAKLLPVVFGFPSPALLSGMAAGRLVLGGDHLIEDCHVWACGNCRSCFRCYPYAPATNIATWLSEQASRVGTTEAPAASSRMWPAPQQRRVGAAAATAAAVAAATVAAAAPAAGTEDEAVVLLLEPPVGMPHYTYEL